jgi:hypothetical protein
MTAAQNPVFPTPTGTELDSVRAGINLRDWFASQAFPALLEATNRNPVFAGKSNADLSRLAASMAYQSADAMLAARGAA